MMNPAWKSITQTTFQLLNTWFTDRTTAVVDWYHDGTPVREASGFQDYFQDPTIVTGPYVDPNNPWHHSDGGGTNLAVTKTGGRFTGAVDTKIADYTDNVHEIKLTNDSGAKDGRITTGIALKAQVLDVNKNNSTDDEKANAKQSAAVTLTGNAARLSGGAFATNGDVKFSTPYTASWTKVETNAAGLTDHEIAGAEWELTTTDGGPYSADFYPGICATSQDDEGKTVFNGWSNGTCWKETTNTDGTKIKSLIIKDNMGSNAYVGVDNNPDGGGFDINNLANGTYKLTEHKAPTGYAPETETGTDGTVKNKSYTFTVDNAQGIWQGGDGDQTPSKRIGNKPLPGVSWAKTDTTLAAKDTVGGSEWKVTMIKDAQGKDVTSQTAYTVADCEDTVAESTDDAAPAANTPSCKDGTNDNVKHVYADTDGASGKFTINPDADGIYKLEETKVPNNTYWHPAEGTVYYFKIVAGNKDTKTAVYRSLDDMTTNNEVENNAIANTSAQVAWSKVAGDDHTKLLGNSEWKISGPYVNNADVTVDGKDITATDVPIKPCTSQPGAKDPCEGVGRVNTVDSATGKVTEYADADPVEGKFLVRNLPAPQTNDGTTYVYKLTETKSPSGYVLPGVTYTFEIGYQQPTGNNGKVQIGQDDKVSKNLQVVHPTDASGKTTGENLIPNVKVVSALPFTGGRAARDWAIVGGLLAFGAGLAYAVVNWYRNRKGLGL